MGGEGDSGGEKPRIDAAAKAAFLKAMREGLRLSEAAAAHGVTLQAFRAARKRDPEFDAGWREAHLASAEAERALSLSPAGCPSTMLGPTAAAQPLRGRHLPPEDASHARPLPSELGEERIVPNNRRRLQRRKMRNVKFDEERQQRFLAHFA